MIIVNASWISQCFVLQVCVVFEGNILTIQICLYAVFINFMYISRANNTASFSYTLSYEGGFSKVKNPYIIYLW